jgi:hypothetical protein
VHANLTENEKARAGSPASGQARIRSATLIMRYRVKALEDEWE